MINQTDDVTSAAAEHMHRCRFTFNSLDFSFLNFKRKPSRGAVRFLLQAVLFNKILVTGAGYEAVRRCGNSSEVNVLQRVIKALKKC